MCVAEETIKVVSFTTVP